METYFNGGKMVAVAPLIKPEPDKGFVLTAAENELIIHKLDINELDAVWDDY